MAASRQAIAAKTILALAALGGIASAALSGDHPARVAAPLSKRVANHGVAPVAIDRVAPPRTPAPLPTPTPTPTALPEALVVKRILDVGNAIKFGDYAWDAKDVPAGPLIVTVDLAAQTLSVFRSGYEIGATAILYGADDKPTPLGVFPITQKDAKHVSTLYDAPMPYMLRLTNDGVSIHGTEVAWGYATHGCIGVPTAFARLLFREAKLGDRVIVTRGKTLATGQAIVG